MKRLIENQGMIGTVRVLFAICLGLGLSATAQADSADYGTATAAQTVSQIANASASNSPVVVCGGQSGHRRLEIRGTDIATVWRSAYHMLFPAAGLAETRNMDRGKVLPDKGPTWRVSVDHGDAVVSIQAKW